MLKTSFTAAEHLDILLLATAACSPVPWLQVTTDIGSPGGNALVLRASGSTVEAPGYMAATKNQEDLDASTVASTSSHELQVP